MQPSTSPHESTSVLIVGGGLGGLSAAMFLASHGVPTILVERHPASSPHPRAIGFTTRTLEIFRSVGLGSRVPQIPEGHGRPRRVVVESLAGAWSDEMPWTPPRAANADPIVRPPSGYSPCTGAAIAQDKLEPILRERATELGADVRMSTELVSFEQDDSGVTARIRRRTDGLETTIRAAYVIAADGHASPVREALGIARTGHGFMHVMRSVLFRAPLDAYLAKGVRQFQIESSDLRGMLTTYGDGRWLLMMMDDEERDDETARRLVTRAIGRDDVPVEILTTGRWVLSALIADRFASGRVFLLGDAAHTLPPARGGFGANTGIADAFNLAWKLASVLAGRSAPSLLDTYDAERRPVAWLRHGQIFNRPDYAAMATDYEKSVAIVDDDAIELGELYRSTAVIGATSDLHAAQRPEQWSGQPGTRAPHVWIRGDGEPRSTLDELTRAWVVVTDDARWAAAARDAATRLGLDVRALSFGEHAVADTTPIAAPNGREPAAFRDELRTAFGLRTGGCSLVRPDGVVAWRADVGGDDAVSTLVDALAELAACPVGERTGRASGA